jgi:uncharacterized membrane protein YjjP (DUF1212 family)
MTTETPDTDALLEFLFRLGQAYLACGEQTALVELFLRRIAAARGVRRSRIVAFPTAIFISLHDDTGERITLAEGPTHSLRLDQVSAVYTLGEAAERGEVDPCEGLEQLNAILRQSPRFGAIGAIVGHTVLAVGLSFVLMPTWVNLATAAVLGLVVGAVKLFNRNRPILSAPLSVVAATLVSTLVFLAIKQGLPIDPLYALVPPLVTFLPGAMLTFGMVELAYGDMVSGSSRLITGFVQLVLLAFGLAAGAAFVGYTPEYLVEATQPTATGFWMSLAPWAGVVVFGLGLYLHFSAPPNSFRWMLLVLFLAYAAQQASAALIGKEASGFFGMLVATPLGYLIQKGFKGPQAMVTFLPSFWLLVPGVLGLVSVKQMLSDRAAGIDGLIGAVFAIVSVALGTLVGASLYKWLTERYGWWRLQVGRVGRYFRRQQ